MISMSLVLINLFGLEIFQSPGVSGLGVLAVVVGIYCRHAIARKLSAVLHFTKALGKVIYKLIPLKTEAPQHAPRY